MKKLLLAAALGCTTLTTFAATQKIETVTSNKKPIVVSQNQTFDIQLKSNPTTGFSWKLTAYQKPLLKFIAQKYVAPTSEILGAPGYELFTFQAKKGNYRVNQVGHIVLSYARPWTKDGATKKTFMVVVKTNSQSNVR